MQVLSGLHVLYTSVILLSEKLLCVLRRAGIACIYHVKRVWLRQTVNRKDADILIPGYDRFIQKTNADPARHQRFDRNKAADGHLPEKVVQFVTGCGQSFLKNFPGT